MNSPSRHGLHQLSTSERNRLAESALSAQEDSAILRAAVDFNGLRFRNHYASFQGHPISALPQGFPSSPQPQGSTQAGLSMLAIMRSNQAFAALRLANARSNPLFGLPPTNRALLLSTSNMGSGGLLKADPMAVMKPLPQAPPISVPRPRETGGEIVRDRNEEALETLGATCLERRKQKSPYFDASALSDPGKSLLFMMCMYDSIRLLSISRYQHHVTSSNKQILLQLPIAELEVGSLNPSPRNCTACSGKPS